MADAVINKSIFIAASRETVWAYLTEKEKLAEWFHPAPNDLSEGNDYALVKILDDGATDNLCWGTVLKMEPPSKMVWSFTVKPLGGAMTKVTWHLEEVNGGTKLSLEHEGIGAAAGEGAWGLLSALDEGWNEHLAKLRASAA
ncbi:MAG: SRPBCC family protein [Rhizobiaceae bacterium]